MPNPNPTAQTVFAYIGSYAEAADPGLYACAYDIETGRLSLIESISGLQNPTFLAIDTPRKKLYAIAEEKSPEGQRLGAAVAYDIDAASGKLTFLNREATVDAPTCHIMLDATRQSIAVASYSGSRIVLSSVLEDGRLGPIQDKHAHEGSSVRPQQDKPHPHSVFLSPDNRFAFVPDLGIDRIVSYKLDIANMKLIPHGETNLEPGAGPRHFAFHPSGAYGYVINELNSTVTAYAYDAAQGQLTEIQSISTLPDSFTGSNSTADIHISADGRFLYGSNRGHDSIAVFAINAADGTLTLVEITSTNGGHPRNFCLSPDNRFLLAANRDANNVVTFARDAETGKLRATGDELQLSMPVCVKFLTV